MSGRGNHTSRLDHCPLVKRWRIIFWRFYPMIIKLLHLKIFLLACHSRIMNATIRKSSNLLSLLKGRRMCFLTILKASHSSPILYTLWLINKGALCRRQPDLLLIFLGNCYRLLPRLLTLDLRHHHCQTHTFYPSPAWVVLLKNSKFAYKTLILWAWPVTLPSCVSYFNIDETENIFIVGRIDAVEITVHGSWIYSYSVLEGSNVVLAEMLMITEK